MKERIGGDMESKHLGPILLFSKVFMKGSRKQRGRRWEEASG